MNKYIIPFRWNWVNIERNNRFMHIYIRITERNKRAEEIKFPVNYYKYAKIIHIYVILWNNPSTILSLLASFTILLAEYGTHTYILIFFFFWGEEFLLSDKCYYAIIIPQVSVSDISSVYLCSASNGISSASFSAADRIYGGGLIALSRICNMTYVLRVTIVVESRGGEFRIREIGIRSISDIEFLTQYMYYIHYTILGIYIVYTYICIRDLGENRCVQCVEIPFGPL